MMKQYTPRESLKKNMQGRLYIINRYYSVFTVNSHTCQQEIK